MITCIISILIFPFPLISITQFQRINTVHKRRIRCTRLEYCIELSKLLNASDWTTERKCARVYKYFNFVLNFSSFFPSHTQTHTHFVSSSGYVLSNNLPAHCIDHFSHSSKSIFLHFNCFFLCLISLFPIVCICAELVLKALGNSSICLI